MGFPAAKTGNPHTDEAIEEIEQGTRIESSGGDCGHPGIATAFKEDGEDVFMGCPDWTHLEIAPDLNQGGEVLQMGPPNVNPLHPNVGTALQDAGLQDGDLVGLDIDTSFQGVEDIRPEITDADLLRCDIAAASQGGGTWPYADLLHSDTAAAFDGEERIGESSQMDSLHPDIAALLLEDGIDAGSQDTGSRHFDIAATLQEGVDARSTDADSGSSDTDSGSPDTDSVHRDIAAHYPSPVSDTDLDHPDTAANSPSPSSDTDLVHPNIAANSPEEIEMPSPITDSDLLRCDLAAFQEGERDTWSGIPDENDVQSLLTAAFPEDRHTVGSGAPEIESGPPKQDESVKEEAEGGQYFQGLSEVESSGNPD